MKRASVPFTALFASLAFVAVLAASASAEQAGSARAIWSTNIVAQMTVTPNYATGYGPVGGTGSGATPAPGALASAGGGYVDFGSVVAGYDYLYKNAALVSVLSNDANGFNVYAEGSTDFTNGTTTLPIAGTLFWLKSSGANSPFTNATPFERTSATVSGTTITYGGAPPSTALIWSYPSATLGQPNNTASAGYDYQLRLPDSAPQAQMSLYVVYTVIPN